MTISTKFEQDVVIIKLKGKIIGGPELKRIDDLREDLLHRGYRKYAIDFRDVKWMDSSGLGVLMRFYLSVANAGGEMVWYSLPKKIHELTIATQTNELVKPCRTIEDAMKILE